MLGKRLRYLREREGFSQKELAKKLDMPNQNVSNYERGFRQPDYETINRMADFFEVTTDYLLGRSDRESLTEKESEEFNEIISTIKKLEESGKEKELEALKAYTKFLANALENED